MQLIHTRVWKKVKKNRFIYLMLLPIAVYFILFNYYPLLLGFFSSFQNIKLIGGSQFVGLENYLAVVKHPLYRQAFENTLVVGVFTFLLQFVWGLLIALLLNEVKNKFIKSTIQSVTYLSYLLSWSVIGGIWILALAPSGFVNGLLELINGEDFKRIVFMAEPKYARFTMVFTGAWKTAGYYAVLFFASIIGIDQSIYESAAIDGASRLRQMFSITLPNIVPTMKVVTMLVVMGLLRNFDQIFVMGNASIYDKVRNLLYLIYNEGIIKFRIGQATAAATLVLLATLIMSYTVRKLIRYDETYD
jgi:putative aldouronate transport system permease protein